MLSTILVLAIFTLLSLLIYKWRKDKYEKFWKHILAIPGPKLYPLVGTIEVVTSESLFVSDRKKARDFFPIYKIIVAYRALIFLISPEDIEMVVNNNKHNTKGTIYLFLHEWLATGLLTSDGTKWRQRRKILTPAFHFNILQEFADIFNAETKILVENLKKICDQPYIDVVKPITDFTLSSIAETSLGITLRDDQNCNEYKKALYDLGENFAYRLVRPWLFDDVFYKMSNFAKRNSNVIKVLHDFTTKVVEEKSKVYNSSYSQRKKLALLDLMLKMKNTDASIDDRGIREELDTFIFEGHDTTSVALGYALMILANHPDIQEEVYQEIVSIVGDQDSPSFSDFGELKYTERCIKESLRLYPSVVNISRFVGEDFTTHSGYFIPKGAEVNIAIYDLHRNPSVWENPEVFDPDRFLPDNIAKRHPYAFLPFSAGSRNCIGQKYAILELKAALCGILRSFKLEAYDRPEHIRFKTDVVLRSADEIRVKFVPRN